MEIRFVQRFPCTPQKLLSILRNPDYERESRAVADVDVAVLRSEEKEGVLTEFLRISSRKELSSFMKTAIGADRMRYEQELVTDTAAMVTRWKILPLFHTDKVTCSGTSRITATADGCERLIQGELKISVPFIGGKIEQGVISELEAGYIRAGEVITRWAQKP